MPSGQPIRAHLVGPGARFETFDAFAGACAETVSDIIWRTCRWSRRPPLDTRCTIFSIAADDYSTVYVRIWSDPQEPVLTEVTSEWSYPGAERYIGARERRLLHGLGFTLARSLTHFMREDIVALRSDAARLARDVLTIIFDVFRYRGTAPLQVERSPDGRPKRGVTRWLDLHEFATLARKLGYEVRPGTGKTPTATLHRGGRHLVVALCYPIEMTDLYQCAALRAPLRLARPLPAAIAEDIAARSGVTRLIDRDGVTCAETYVHLDGLSLFWLAEQCALVERARDLAERSVSGLLDA